MKMQDYFCDFFEMDIEVPSEAFDKVAFLEDIKDISDINRKGHTWSYGSVDAPGSQHAHIFVDLRGEGKIQITMRFYSQGIKEKDARPPYMENCGQWIGQFVKADNLPATIQASYRFGEGYSPIVAMPFPLLSPRKALKGAQVIGMGIRPPRKMGIKHAILQMDKYSFTIFVDRSASVNLGAFDLEEELKLLANPIMAFVVKTGADA